MMRALTFVTITAAGLFAGAAAMSGVNSGTAVAPSQEEEAAHDEAASTENAVTATVHEEIAEETSHEHSANFAEHQPELFLRTLLEREQSLERREQAMANEREALESIRGEVEARIEELQAVRDEMAQQLGQLDRARADRIESLAAWCTGMEPRQAAAHLSTQEDELVVEVLMAMEQRGAAAVLESFEPQRAATVIEALSRARPQAQ